MQNRFRYAIPTKTIEVHIEIHCWGILMKHTRAIVALIIHNLYQNVSLRFDIMIQEQYNQFEAKMSGVDK